MAITTRAKKPRSAFMFWPLRISAAAMVLALLAVTLALLNNNFSVRRRSRAEFTKSLDETIGRSTDWAVRQYRQDVAGSVSTQEGLSLISNPATAHMVVDCTSLADDPRMKALGTSFVDSWREVGDIWSKMVDPSITARPPTTRELQVIPEYLRWTLHGVAPKDVPLSPGESADMFTFGKHRTGKATHQLFALYFYRKSSGATPELEHLMNQIEERIASEAALDFRVTDLYLQRIAFLLAAGRPDLVRPRWVERAFAAQQSNGGWLGSWHGWTRTPYRFSFGDNLPNSHSTAQGMWIAYMLKYRYPEWIDKNYK